MTNREYRSWRKSVRSNTPGENCVEVSPSTDGGYVGVRDTKARSAGTQEYTAAEWKVFIAGVKDGEFDFL